MTDTEGLNIDIRDSGLEFTNPPFESFLSTAINDPKELNFYLKEFLDKGNIQLIQDFIKKDAFKLALNSYFDFKVQYPNLVLKDPSLIDNLFFNILKHLIDLNLTKIYPSLTQDNSIYLRMYTHDEKEIHLEVFYDYDENEEDDIEAVTSIYEGDTIIMKDYGTLEEVCGNILHTINKNQEVNTSNTGNKEYYLMEAIDYKDPDFSDVSTAL